MIRIFLTRWLINTLAVWVAAAVVTGIHHGDGWDLLLAALLLGIFNTFLRPILKLLTLPLVLITLGLFIIVINAGLLYLVGSLLKPHFYVDGFWPAFWGALIISIISTILGALTGVNRTSVKLKVRQRPPDDDGRGPVIDV